MSVVYPVSVREAWETAYLTKLFVATHGEYRDTSHPSPPTLARMLEWVRIKKRFDKQNP